MAETRTTRMGLPQYSAGTDSPSRADFNEGFLQLETLATKYAQGTLAARPAAAASNGGMFYTITGDSALLNDLVYYSNGTKWILIGQFQKDLVAQASAAGTVALIVKAFTSGTADLQQWADTTGTTVLRVDNTGKIIGPAIDISGAATIVTLQVTGNADVDGVITGDYKSLSVRADGLPKAQINEDGSGRFDGLIPPKAMIFIPTLPIPAGWLECDGSAVSRTTYVDLWNALGNPNTGDGSTTFNLPDMRDRFPTGRSVSKAIGTTGGTDSVTLSVAQLPAHHHDITHQHAAAYTAAGGNHTHSVDGINNFVRYGSGNINITFGGNNNGQGQSLNPGYSGDHQHWFQPPTWSGNSGDTGSGTAVNITPKYFAGAWVIKY